jgi:hypothetical protein
MQQRNEKGESTELQCKKYAGFEAKVGNGPCKLLQWGPIEVLPPLN